MQKFRQHTVQLLVATDVAARGLDVDDLTHVINYGLPDDIENYTHRSGRTGRAGKKGTSLSIVHSREKHKIRNIEKEIGKAFEEGQIPSAEEICKKQLYKVMDQIVKADVDEEQIAPFMQDIDRYFEYVDKEDLIKKIVSMEFGKFLAYYADAPEISEVRSKKEEGRSKREEGRGRRGEKKGNEPRVPIAGLQDYRDYSNRSFVNRTNTLGNPDIILICGGTNDSWAGSPIGDYVYGNWTTEQLYYFRPAMAKMLYDLRGNYPTARLLFILNSELRESINESVHTICKHYDVECLDLKDIEKQAGHPSVKGMTAFAQQVAKALEKKKK